jgi:hypothetical protein
VDNFVRNNFVVVGDSFCQHVDDHGWTWLTVLADKLDLRLISRGYAGGSFWELREFLADNVNADTDYIIITHTDISRLPSAEWHFQFENLSKAESAELARSVANAKQQYYKYIFETRYHEWAVQQWFKELSETYKDYKVINLHCFPKTWNLRHLLSGMNVGPCLAALSLNEIGATDQIVLGNDTNRYNHFNPVNNRVLGEQLYELMTNYKEGDVLLDTSAFEQKTTRWIDNWDL